MKEIKIGEVKDFHQGATGSDTGTAQLKVEVWEIPAPFSAAFELGWAAY